MSKARIIGKNISFVALSRAISMLISFSLFPFILKHIGKEIYGIYLIAMTVTGYLGLLDLGVMSALTKYVSEYNGKKDYKTINKVANASFSFYVFIGLVIALLLFTCAIYFNNFFKVDPSNIKIVRQLFLLAAISALLVWPLNTFRGVIQGLNLWSVDAVINVLIQIINAIATFIILSRGYGIVQLFIVTQALTIIGSMGFYYMTKKKICLKINFPYREFNTYKYIFNFGIFVFFGSLINILVFEIHNIIIGYFISISAVSIYAVASNIQDYLRAINSTIGSPPWIVASEMEGSHDYDGQKKLVLKGTKYVSAVFLPVTLIIFFFMRPFINYWMGSGFQESITPARIIIIFWFFNGTLELASGMISAKGMVKKQFFIQLVVAIVNVFIAISLIKILGINAIALGLTLSMIFVGFPLNLRLSLRILHIKLQEYFHKAVRNNLSLYLFVILLSLLILKFLYPKNIYFTLLEMAAVYLVSLALYYLVVLDKDERGEIKKLLGAEQLYGRIKFTKEIFS